MNERIKQLKKQAHIERRQEYFSSVVDPTIKSVSVTRHFDLNLFAELIVKECGQYLNSPEFIGRSDLDWAMVLNEHFGVE